MDKLASDLQQINLLPHRMHISLPYPYSYSYTIAIAFTHSPSAERDAHLEQVKVYGRDPTNADPIFTKEAGRTLP